MVLRQMSNFVIGIYVKLLNFDGQWGDIFNQFKMVCHKMDFQSSFDLHLN